MARCMRNLRLSIVSVEVDSAPGRGVDSVVCSAIIMESVRRFLTWLDRRKVGVPLEKLTPFFIPRFVDVSETQKARLESLLG